MEKGKGAGRKKGRRGESGVDGWGEKGKEEDDATVLLVLLMFGWLYADGVHNSSLTNVNRGCHFAVMEFRALNGLSPPYLEHYSLRCWSVWSSSSALILVTGCSHRLAIPSAGVHCQLLHPSSWTAYLLIFSHPPPTLTDFLPQTKDILVPPIIRRHFAVTIDPHIRFSGPVRNNTRYSTHVKNSDLILLVAASIRRETSSLALMLCSEQYNDDFVELTVSVDGQVVGHRRLAYSASSLKLAGQLSTFYSRLLDVACRHHSRREQLDDELVRATKDAPSHALHRLFAVYRRCSSNSAWFLSL